MNRSKTVMMIDDDFEDQEIFRDVLREIDPGIECKLCSEADEALGVLAQGDRLPDWIFVDLNMPVMNGFEFLEEVKKNELIKDIPVVIYTTSNENSQKAKARDLGAFSFITKPSDLIVLKERLLDLLMADHVDHH